MRRTMRFTVALVALLFGAFLAAGCARGTSTPSAPSLDGTSWTLTRLHGEQLLAKTEITLAFEEGQVAGKAGCNRYFGQVTVDGNKLSIGPVGSTEMYCAEPEGVMDQETAFLRTLESVAAFRLENGELTFLDSAGQSLMTFSAAAE